MPRNRKIVLASRPRGDATVANFRLEEEDLPALVDGQVLVRIHYLSLDPYMRGRMDDAKSYAVPQKLDQVMGGGTVGEVIESRNPKYSVGDRVVAPLGWQEYGISKGEGFRKISDTSLPLSVYLGSVGMPGVTAWYGLNKIVNPKAGQTIVVSAASGAVGSVVGQLAKKHGCRVVGTAGGPQKCAYVRDELGFDACIDYRSADVDGQITAATPEGVDGLFENVGGAVMDLVLSRMNAFGRIAVCGLIAGYNGAPTPVSNFKSILINRLTVEGFIVSEHADLLPQALKELGGLVLAGELKFRESVAQGLDAAPDAFLGLLAGRNFGKQLVKLI